MRIILSGGGTLGSVSPLIAVYTTLRAQGFSGEVLWVGTKNGPETQLVREYQIPFRAIPAGKWRRYFSLQNIFDPVKIFFALVGSFSLLLRYKPALIVSAGGFVSVPLVWAARWCRVPVVIHQQDVVPGLANKLMAGTAKVVTVTFQRSFEYFGNKSVLTGNPVRSDLTADRVQALELFQFRPDLPVILILGGGTGAAAINALVYGALEMLVGFAQVIHVTGPGKGVAVTEHPYYRAYEFLNPAKLAQAYAAATLVVCRAGMSTLTELANLGKAAAVIPIPGSHQQANAIEFGKFNACEILNQTELDPAGLAQALQELVGDTALLHSLEKNIRRVLPPDATERFIAVLNSITPLI